MHRPFCAFGFVASAAFSNLQVQRVEFLGAAAGFLHDLDPKLKDRIPSGNQTWQ